MALVTLETYAGDKVAINPDDVSTVTVHNFYDHDKELPAEFLHLNPGGFYEVSPDPEIKAKADAFRTSERTLVLMASGTSFEVKGTQAEVVKALGGK